MKSAIGKNQRAAHREKETRIRGRVWKRECPCSIAPWSARACRRVQRCTRGPDGARGWGTRHITRKTPKNIVYRARTVRSNPISEGARNHFVCRWIRDSHCRGKEARNFPCSTSRSYEGTPDASIFPGNRWRFDIQKSKEEARTRLTLWHTTFVEQYADALNAQCSTLLPHHVSKTPQPSLGTQP